MQLATAGYRKKTCICRWLRLEGTKMYFLEFITVERAGGKKELQFSLPATTNFNNLYFHPVK